MIVPGIGYAGLGQTTRAAQLVFSRAMGGRARSTGSKRRRRRATAQSSRGKRTATKKRRRSSRAARLVKGSAAAKRYMAKIRKMRK